MWLSRADPFVMIMSLIPATNTIWQCALQVSVCSITKSVRQFFGRAKIVKMKHPAEVRCIKGASGNLSDVFIKSTFLRYKSFLFNCKMNTQVFLSGFINEILISVDAQQNTNKYIRYDRDAATIGK